MTTPELLEFIRIEHALGMGLPEITRLLISEGDWDRADVAEAFRAMGLPEQAAEEFSDKQQHISPEAPLPIDAPKMKEDDVIRHAPAPVSAPAPKDMVYPAHAAPMHYVEQPEEKPKPTLARPASLTPQAGRSLVRNSHNTIATSKQGTSPITDANHNGPTIHVSRLQHVGGTLAHSVVEPPKITKSKEAIETKVLYGLDLEDDEPSPHKVATPSAVSASKVAASVLLEHKDSPVSTNMQGVEEKHTSDEHKITAPLVEEKEKLPDTPAPESVHDSVSIEAEKKESKVIIEPTTIQPESPKQQPVEIKKEEPAAPIVPTTPPLVEPVQAVLPPTPAPAHVEEKVPVVATPPLSVTPPPQPQPAPVPPPPVPPPAPAPVQVAPQIIVVPSAMFGNQQFGYGGMPMPGNMQQMQQMQQMQPGQFPQFPNGFGGMHTTEMASSAPDIEEQAYLARFGQAPMPSGISMPNTQPVVTPTIIYAPQIIGSDDAKSSSISNEPKKPEPVRFDIGKLRNTHKIDPANYGQKPSVLSAISGMEPVKTESLEDMFKKEQPQREMQTEEQLEKSNIVHSLKVPSKRTMTADLIRVGEGVLPEQVVAQATRTEAVAGVALPEAPVVLDEEPVPPPPPKKASKSIFILTIAIVITIFGIGALTYYYVVLRMPGGEEIFKRAISQLSKGPYVEYSMQGNVRATSTDAEPEYINSELAATGTLALSSDGFKDASHSINFSLDHSGVVLPIHLAFDGLIHVEGSDVFVSQKTPTRGTPIENVLKQDEWVKFPYQNLGMIFGFSPDSGSSSDDYGLVTPSLSLFGILFHGNFITASDNVVQYADEGKEYYRVPVRLNTKGMIQAGDALSKYLRGVTAVPTSPQREAVLANRYKVFTGELIVDKLLMRPVSMFLYASFDPKLIPLDGSLAARIDFRYPEDFAPQKIQSKTMEEWKTKRADEAVSEAVIARDTPARIALPTIVLALNQFAAKQEYFPLSLQELVQAGFLNKDSFPAGLLNKILYSVSAVKPEESGKTGLPCAPKKGKCGFFHIGTSLEYVRSEELATDADVSSFMIKGADNAGCSGEPSRACFDFTGSYP